MNTKSSATCALGFENMQLPYLYSGPIAESCRSMAQKGFEAVEFIVPDPGFVSVQEVRDCLSVNGLALSAIGTGGAYITKKLHLCSPETSIRDEAVKFIQGAIDLASPFQAVVILGLVTGLVEPGVTRDDAFGWLTPALNRLGKYAADRDARLVIEPVNRYESNLINCVEDGLGLLARLDVGGIKLLVDLFHMNIEEPSIEAAICTAGDAIGHVHFVDSNRWAPGMGHIGYAEFVWALGKIEYSSYISIEALPRPDSETAATKAIEAYQHWFGRKAA